MGVPLLNHKWPKQIPSSASCRPQKRRRDVFVFCVCGHPTVYDMRLHLNAHLYSTRGQTQVRKCKAAPPSQIRFTLLRMSQNCSDLGPTFQHHSSRKSPFIVFYFLVSKTTMKIVQINRFCLLIILFCVITERLL